MKKSFFLAAIAAVAISASAFSQSVDEIVEKHIAARGGADKLKALSSVVQENSLSVQGMDIPMKITTVTGKGLRQELEVMGNQMITAVDGEAGWVVMPAMMGGSGSPEDMSADQLKGAKAGLDPTGGLFNYKEKGSTVELVGKEKVNGADAFNLKVTSKDGYTSNLLIDATTYLLSKTVATTSQAGQTFTQEMWFTNYKDVDGIKFAHTSEMTSPMGGTMTLTTNKVIVNGTVDPAIFKKPAK